MVETEVLGQPCDAETFRMNDSRKGFDEVVPALGFPLLEQYAMIWQDDGIQWADG